MNDRSYCDYREKACRMTENGDAIRKYTGVGAIYLPRAWLADIGIFVTDKVAVRKGDGHLEIWPIQEEK